MVQQWQKLYFDNRHSGSDKSLHTKDFVKTAEADGFEFAKRLDNTADLPAVIREILDFQGPVFLEVIIDRDAGVYPMVGPGQSYENWITGDYIKSRAKPSDDKPGPSEMF